jgi:hypothetical protein
MLDGPPKAANTGGDSFATAAARIVTARAPSAPAAGSTGSSIMSDAGARIVSGRGWAGSGGGTGSGAGSGSNSATAAVSLLRQASIPQAALATVASISCSGVPDIVALCSSLSAAAAGGGGGAGGGGPVASPGHPQASAAGQDVPQLLALATQALDVLAMHQRRA